MRGQSAVRWRFLNNQPWHIKHALPMASLELANIAVVRDKQESCHTATPHSSLAVVFSWRKACGGRANLVACSVAFRLLVSTKLVRLHGPLNQRILSPRAHSSLLWILASEKTTKTNERNQHNELSIMMETLNLPNYFQIVSKRAWRVWKYTWTTLSFVCDSWTANRLVFLQAIPAQSCKLKSTKRFKKKVNKTN